VIAGSGDRWNITAVLSIAVDLRRRHVGAVAVAGEIAAGENTITLEEILKWERGSQASN